MSRRGSNSLGGRSGYGSPLPDLFGGAVTPLRAPSQDPEEQMQGLTTTSGIGSSRQRSRSASINSGRPTSTRPGSQHSNFQQLEGFKGGSEPGLCDKCKGYVPIYTECKMGSGRKHIDPYKIKHLATCTHDCAPSRWTRVMTDDPEYQDLEGTCIWCEDPNNFPGVDERRYIHTPPGDPTRGSTPSFQGQIETPPGGWYRIDCRYRVKDTAHLFESKGGAQQQSQDQEHQILGQPGPSTQPGWRQESPMQLDSPLHPHSGRSNRTSRSSSQSQPQTPGMTAENIALLLAFNQGGPSQAENQSEQNLPVPTSQSTLHAAASHPPSSTHPTHSNHPAQTSSSKGKRTEREKSSSSDQESTRSPRDSQKKPSKKGRTKK
ncbi:hypothetical protein L207DRAFT_582185 [Hyaloscypha variabilis F]|uniref:Uncharacterized protein n=1 Tax=Hyaloscypha variabilis (strain UAMH 11265 / GT02V1 / F) TaxID=1149755 RepID=A0A2J6RTB6_HYAVF|nr:hypothetical protein L207DRAFT_582185 [Hyaloscypha variabilis F]